MYPRGTLDIGWSDLAYGLVNVFRSEAPRPLRGSNWCRDDALVCLSVRSGLDLVLQDLDPPQGSEVIMSAITIPGMERIVRKHGLVPVPVDLDPDTLELRQKQLEDAVSSETCAILYAHLFGSRGDLEPVVDCARRHNLFLMEDCAQAYSGDESPIPPGVDVSLFSFGPTKTATALGGAVLLVRDSGQRQRLEQLQDSYSPQSHWAFFKRVLKYCFLKILATPTVFGLFGWLCRLAGTNHDDVIANATRGFSGKWTIEQFRKQPCAALRSLLGRRLQQSHRSRVEKRVQHAQKIIGKLAEDRFPGTGARDHAHWVLPFASDDPEDLVDKLWDHGYDATKKGSSLRVVAPPESPDAPPLRNSRELLRRVVYLPMYDDMPENAIQELCDIITEEEMGEGQP